MSKVFWFVFNFLCVSILGHYSIADHIGQSVEYITHDSKPSQGEVIGQRIGENGEKLLKVRLSDEKEVEAPIDQFQFSNSVLLVIDVQESFLKNLNQDIKEPYLKNIASQIEKAKKRGKKIILVRYGYAGPITLDIVNQLNEYPNTVVIEKNTDDGSKDIKDHLDQVDLHPA